jgi:thiamine-phosphate pyrophosphorylase
MNGADRRARLEHARLYVCTGAREEHGDLTAFLDAILGAGVDIVQLREKAAEGGDLLRWSETFRSAADRHGGLFVVNDRADIALAARADGVHMGQGDLPVTVTRDVVGPEVLIGLSTHTIGEREQAPAEADYVCVGPVHATPTKVGRPAAGTGVVEAAAEREARPWFAIGGLDPGTLPDVVRAGARRIVVVRAVTEASDPGGVVRELLAALPR